MRSITLFVLTALLLQGRTQATMYVLPTWEELAEGSEFIGVVECVTAGGIVARYRVTDSWKGAAVGTELVISQHASYFEPQYPISLVGESFLVFAEKAPSYRVSSFSSGGAVPLWWRRIPKDLSCFRPIPLKESVGRDLSSHLGYRGGGLSQFKADVLGFLQGAKEHKELRMMLAVARKNLNLPDPSEPSDPGDKDDRALYESLLTAKNVEQLLRTITERSAQLAIPTVSNTEVERRSQGYKFTLLEMVSDGGRERCKELLEKADLSKLPWGKHDIEKALSAIRRNLSPEYARWGSPEAKDPSKKMLPTKDDIAEAEVTLSKAWDYHAEHAFELLCEHAPDPVVAFLLQWEPSMERRDEQFGYVLGSAFGHICAVDRAKHLKALLAAKDDWIKASAAVYLCFDDPEVGRKSLRQMMALDGDPGSWAALVLASRGDKSAILRAMEVMATPNDGGMLSVNHGNLQKRLRVLLSNVADQSRVSQPPPSPNEYPKLGEQMIVQKQWHEALIAWWKASQESITISDPWANLLDEQKVD